MFLDYTAVSDLVVSMPQCAQFSTQICFLLLQGHHCKKTQLITSVVPVMICRRMSNEREN